MGSGRRETGRATLSGWGCQDSRFCTTSPGGRREEVNAYDPEVMAPQGDNFSHTGWENGADVTDPSQNRPQDTVQPQDSSVSNAEMASSGRFKQLLMPSLMM